MSFMRLSKVLLPLSLLMMAGSLVLLFNPGPRLSIEFTGGTLLEVRLPDEVTQQELTESIGAFDQALADSTSIARTKNETYLVRTRTLDDTTHNDLISAWTEDFGEVRELQYTSIGPTVGSSLKSRSIWALVAALVAIVLYLAFAFRNIPRTLSPWAFGMGAIVALAHDVLIMAGIFTVLSHTTSFQLDTLFVTALLSVMGYSVNDTIIIFDRIRDNLMEKKKESLGDIADNSIRQTLTRTLNTSIGTFIMLLALFFLGSESISWFMLALIVGTVVGTYSSIFIAAPVLVFWQRRRK